MSRKPFRGEMQRMMWNREAFTNFVLNNYFEYEPSENPTCKHFGCGKKLTPQENLYSDFCVNHQKKKASDEHKNSCLC